ncbi:Hypothetical predicted protein [Octopus vulgaris]|uniref:Uncharacterized protein n=1 Tax=Octopus vulgaris TaxID=6645 RepID=A0AA36BB70_OCTVU|nr:Hypothetical predicted protein [Octopus vulgaris]
MNFMSLLFHNSLCYQYSAFQMRHDIRFKSFFANTIPDIHVIEPGECAQVQTFVKENILKVKDMLQLSRYLIHVFE